MQSRLNPYISFKDNARQAMQFYQSVFGGKLSISTFKEYGASEDPSEGDKIMHAMLGVQAKDVRRPRGEPRGADIKFAIDR